MLGLLLWNIAFDDILKEEVSPGVNVICYEDDTLVVTVENDIPTLERKDHPGGYDLLDRVGWAEPSNHKDGSGAVYMPSSVQSPSFCLKREQIRLCMALKYLGLWFDGKLTL